MEGRRAAGPTGRVVGRPPTVWSHVVGLVDGYLLADSLVGRLVMETYWLAVGATFVRWTVWRASCVLAGRQAGRLAGGLSD